MTTSNLDCGHQKHAPFFDVDPVAGFSIEVFYADRTLESFGRGGAGWFWWPRRRGFAPEGPTKGPFPSAYLAYLNAVNSVGANEALGTAFFGRRGKKNGAGCKAVAT